MMPELCIRNIKWYGILFLGYLYHFVSWNKKKLCIFVNKILYQPWTSNSVYFGMLPCYPLHIQDKVVLSYLNNNQSKAEIIIVLANHGSPIFLKKSTKKDRYQCGFGGMQLKIQTNLKVAKTKIEFF